MKIEKKAWPELFEKVLSGDKTFDVRLADSKIKIGDLLVLKEWDPKTKSYTGREIEKKVTFALQSKDLKKFWTKEEIEKHGFQIIAFE